MKLDLNSDMGEGFGNSGIENDIALLDYISSTNIACGWHAGDPARMRELVQRALKKNVFIGAHPGLPDLAGFGRREMSITENDAYNFVIYQAGALNAFVKAFGGRLHHVKPHGALYNQAAKDPRLAKGIAHAVKDLGNNIILYALAGSEMVDAAREIGVEVWEEVFADRRYNPDGSLVHRSNANALIEEEDQALNQILSMARDGSVLAIDRSTIRLNADTLCIHGDHAHAVQFAKKISQALSNL